MCVKFHWNQVCKLFISCVAIHWIIVLETILVHWIIVRETTYVYWIIDRSALKYFIVIIVLSISYSLNHRFWQISFVELLFCNQVSFRNYHFVNFIFRSWTFFVIAFEFNQTNTWFCFYKIDATNAKFIFIMNSHFVQKTKLFLSFDLKFLVFLSCICSNFHHVKNIISCFIHCFFLFDAFFFHHNKHYRFKHHRHLKSISKMKNVDFDNRKSIVRLLNSSKSTNNWMSFCVEKKINLFTNLSFIFRQSFKIQLYYS